jgi:hypothetical protein
MNLSWGQCSGEAFCEFHSFREGDQPEGSHGTKEIDQTICPVSSARPQCEVTTQRKADERRFGPLRLGLRLVSGIDEGGFPEPNVYGGQIRNDAFVTRRGSGDAEEIRKQHVETASGKFAAKVLDKSIEFSQ